jgi:hypothetical protein
MRKYAQESEMIVAPSLSPTHATTYESLALGATAPIKAKPKVSSAPPAAFGDDALVDAKTCAAGGNASLSWWFEKVASGEAPPPEIQLPRFTRWNLGKVRQFWREFPSKAATKKTADEVAARAKVAAAASLAKRKATGKSAGKSEKAGAC